MFHDVRGIINAVRRVAAVNDIKISICDVDKPVTGDRELVLPYLSPYASKKEVEDWVGSAYREVGHYAPEVADMQPFMKEREIGEESLLGTLMDIVDGLRNESNHHGYWPGRDEALSEWQGRRHAEGVDSIKQLMSEGTELSPDDNLTLSTVAAIANARSKFQPDVTSSAFDLAELGDTNLTQRIIDKYSHAFETLETAEDVYNVVSQIIEESDQHDMQEEQQAAQEAFEAEQEKKAQDEDGDSEDQNGDGEDNEDGDKGEGQSEKLAKPFKREKPREASEMEIEAMSTRRAGGARRFNYSDPYVPVEEVTVKKAQDFFMEVQQIKDDDEWLSNDIREMYDFYRSGRSLSASARRLFQATMQRAKEHNRMSGRLDKRDLYRIPAGDRDVFYRKTPVSDPKGTALFLLTDMSGSMSEDNKMGVTGAAITLMNEAIQPLGVATEIAGFTDNLGDGPTHILVKEFHEKPTPEEILKRYESGWAAMSQNADGESVMWALSRLMKRKEERKILIVLSDGEPASARCGNICEYTREAVAYASKHVECYGIGILSGEVQEYYPEYVVLDNAEQLEACLLSVVKRKIF